MAETYYAGVYWGVRKESASECAHRLATCLSGLTGSATTLRTWFQTGDSREMALAHQVRPDAHALESLLVAGRNRKDADGAVWEELGFRTSLWTGKDDDDQNAHMMVKCGSYAPRPGVNSCVLNLPSAGTAAEEVLRTPTLVKVMTALVTAWDPDWGIVNSNDAQRLPALRRPPNTPRAGWVMYLSNRRGSLPRLPAPTQVLPLDNRGSLVILTEDRFTASNPAHIELAQRVLQELDRAGGLGPLV